MSHAPYLADLTPQNFWRTLNWCIKHIQHHHPTANLLFGRGLSSTMVLPALAAKAKMQWAIVRKNTNDCLSSNLVEVSAWPREARALFVDDLIATGDTATSCTDTLERVWDTTRDNLARWELPENKLVSLEFVGAICFQSQIVYTQACFLREIGRAKPECRPECRPAYLDDDMI